MKRQAGIGDFFSPTGKRSSTAKPSNPENAKEPMPTGNEQTKLNLPRADPSKTVNIPQFSKNSSQASSSKNNDNNIEIHETHEEDEKKTFKEPKTASFRKTEKDLENDEMPEKDDHDPDYEISEEQRPTPKFGQDTSPTPAKNKPGKPGTTGKNDKDKWELPSFVKPENIMDKYKRRPDHPDYDKTTVYVPEKEFLNMTATVKQYWQIKSQNYDKVLLFKLGKFYEMFAEDAMICHKLLDLNWTGPLHVGFPEKCLDKYGAILVNHGLKVVVAEQMETPKNMKKRLQSSKNAGKKDDKTIKREVCQVLSKGLLVEHGPNNYEAKYILSIYTDQTKTIGVAIIDIAALNIKLGQFEDDQFWYFYK